ncbi:Deoxyguanosinetriphosphate triphosphohydrolase-like protein [Caprobacter fermentans]|uniref:Deoxyguanosinetriphosphate triphosphohydrolase-like protein n=1 Tax=Caproicibacter fermentans TaxID=2576756 RepID=A0A6N8I4H0_9FIRM|nr:deoxyguanosinetriphosphate triphosphohydrolase [Caproicibacter fermentans]MVB13026.1 Deoxyguanosinetriphosphate triphosphohydrolase-like protein [Caproicibacter fermentans]OCN02444.1 deoxyguanosinetriphosphate triphosphohydrolase [Clostridium sp. W14A]QNK41289.1 deoxyguanosinetriphosphate triphosphohydrolase [Caproicibacter fermentans]
MTVCERIQNLEEQTLSPYAMLSRNSAGRETQEMECDLRTPYQRDRDRIIHCKAFRRLKHKTQVFLSPEGDHYRTRLTHTLEVAQIARTIARALQLNEDLTEAISLGHDLGHTPFGHAGERALDQIFPGGFRHYEQSVRVVERLEKNGKGLNLTKEVRDGILCHTTGTEALTMEGRIVRTADRIAYLNHDIDDAERAGVLTEGEIPERITSVLGHRKSKRIDTLVRSVIEGSQNGTVGMRPEVQAAFDLLRDFMFQSVYENPYAKGEERKVPHLIGALFDYLQKPENLPEDMRLIAEQDGCARAACDYIAGMTDHYAVELFKSIYVPASWKI